MPIQGYTGGCVLIFGGGGSSGNPIPPAPSATDPCDQNLGERLMGMPEAFGVKASYVGFITPEMAELVDELLQ